MSELRQIPIGLIDEPPLPIRATMDDAKLRELADSIGHIGLQNPITVIMERPECECPELAQGVHSVLIVSPSSRPDTASLPDTAALSRIR